MADAEDTPFTLETFPDREAWLARRREGIGASDAPGVLNVSPWSSPFTVYCDKVGLERNRDEERKRSERLKWGALLQDPIAKELAERLKIPITLYPPTTIWANRMVPWLMASLDGETVMDGQKGAVEIKTASVFERGTWTHEGEVPLPYQVQCQHQMAVTGYKFVLIGVLIGTEELRHTIVERDPELIPMMVDREEKFWEQIQARQAPDPDGSDESKKLLNKLVPYSPGMQIDLADQDDLDLDVRWKTAAAEAKRWADELDLTKNLVQARLGGAAMARLANGSTWVNTLQKRKGYTANVAATEFRVLKRG